MIVIGINNAPTSILKDMAKQLKRGAVIVYPTDTAYGLGCDATNAQAVARIFAIKGRAAAKGLPLIVADVTMAKKFFRLSFPRRRESNYHGSTADQYGLDPRLRGGDKRILSLTKKHWPGPLSIILPAKGKIAKAALEQGTAAVRVPNSALARQLTKFLGRPLAATSANLSGQPACYSAKAYLKQAKGKLLPDFVLDAGALPRRKPSTIVRLGKSGTIEVLRQGPVKLEITKN